MESQILYMKKGFEKWANPFLFFIYFAFQTHFTMFTTNKCEKCPSSMWYRDLNSRPLEHESLSHNH